MKVVKTTIAALSLSVMSFTAVAEPLNNSANEAVRNQSKVIEVLVTDSKEEAYQGALKKLNSLIKSSPNRLASELHIAGGNDVDTNSLHLKAENFVTVAERMKLDGSMQYIGLVNVNYHYLEDKSRN